MTGLTDADLAAAIAAYDRDGATVLRQVVDRDQLAPLGKAIDALMASGTSGRDMSTAGGGRFFGDNFSWLRQPEFEAFLRESGLAAIAGRILRSREIRLFYDQLLVKEPRSERRTPWHQDLPYWPVSGEQILSLWVAVDAASPDNGVVTYVKGSHRWQRFFPMESFTDGQSLDEARVEGGAIYDDPDAEGWGTLADIDRHPERYEFVTWAVEPGDVIVHHPLTIHGAPGNLSNDARRRALATRWLGDDARWSDSRPHFLRQVRRAAPDFPYPQLADGAPLDDPLFPRLWVADAD